MFIADAYVSDEIIVARSGKRIRIGNTDAEGRMVMADVLCHMKEKVHTTVHIRIRLYWCESESDVASR